MLTLGNVYISALETILFRAKSASVFNGPDCSETRKSTFHFYQPKIIQIYWFQAKSESNCHLPLPQLRCTNRLYGCILYLWVTLILEKPALAESRCELQCVRIVTNLNVFGIRKSSRVIQIVIKVIQFIVDI